MVICGKNLHMKRFNLPLIADTLLAALCAFLLFFTLFRHYFTAAAGIAAGVVAAIACGAAAFCYMSIKRHKKFLLSSARACEEKLAAHLSLLGEEQALQLLAGCFDGAEAADGRVENAEAVCYASFTPEPADRNSLLPAARDGSGKKVYFACNCATAACADMAEQLGIELLCTAEIYSALDKRGKLPEKYLYEQRPRARFFARLKARFTRKLCLPSFWSGAALLFFSYFTFYPVYYIVAGSLLLLLCAAAAIFGQRKSI